MKRRINRGKRDTREGQRLNPLDNRFFYQDLPTDVQMVVLQGVKARLSRDYLPEDLGLLNLDDLRDEDADDIINRYNIRRTIKDWLQLAESGQQ